MKELIVGQIIKGEDLENFTLCKILSNNLKMNDFKYKIGENIDIHNICSFNKFGLYFCKLEHIHLYLNFGTKIAFLKVPKDEFVYVEYKKFKTHKLIVEKIFDLKNIVTWKYLLKKGLDLNKEEIINYLSYNGYLNILKFFNDNNLIDLSLYFENILEFSIISNHIDILKYLVKNGCQLNIKNDFAIKNACKLGFLNIVKFLYEHKVDICVNNNEPLLNAFFYNHNEVVDYLLKNGAMFPI